MYKVGELVVLKKGTYFQKDIIVKIIHNYLNKPDSYDIEFETNQLIEGSITDEMNEILDYLDRPIAFFLEIRTELLKPLNEDFWNYIETGKIDE